MKILNACSESAFCSPCCPNGSVFASHAICQRQNWCATVDWLLCWVRSGPMGPAQVPHILHGSRIWAHFYHLKCWLPRCTWDTPTGAVSCSSSCIETPLGRPESSHPSSHRLSVKHHARLGMSLGSYRNLVCRGWNSDRMGAWIGVTNANSAYSSLKVCDAFWEQQMIA